MSAATSKLTRKEAAQAFQADVLLILAEQKAVIGALAHAVTNLQQQVAELKVLLPPSNE